MNTALIHLCQTRILPLFLTDLSQLGQNLKRSVHEQLIISVHRFKGIQVWALTQGLQHSCSKASQCWIGLDVKVIVLLEHKFFRVRSLVFISRFSSKSVLRLASVIVPLLALNSPCLCSWKAHPHSMMLLPCFTERVVLDGNFSLAHCSTCWGAQYLKKHRILTHALRISNISFCLSSINISHCSHLTVMLSA